MGFWSIVGDLLAKGVKTGQKKINENIEKYDSNYKRYGEEFSDMSDEDLRREVERLRNQTGGDYFAKMGKMKALQNELESRK